MKYKIFRTSQFRKSYKLCVKRGYPIEELVTVITKLADDIPLEEKYHDHELIGQLNGIRECHIRPKIKYFPKNLAVSPKFY